MTRKSVFIWVACGLLLSGASRGQDVTTTTTTTPATPALAQATGETAPAPSDPALDDVVLRSRTPVQALTEHFVGSTSRAVRFDWRRSMVMVGVMAGEVVEKNNFSQQRYGLQARKALGDVIVEGGVHFYTSDDTLSSQLLALTPYRQAGRPRHLELDLNIGYPIAEGVVTPVTSFVPPAEIALVALGGARYLGYWQTFPNRPIQDIGLDLASPRLSTTELDRLDEGAPEAMAIDSARLHALVGLGVDTYVQPGLWISPRAMVAVPVLAPVTGTALGFFWELSLLLGWAF